MKNRSSSHADAQVVHYSNTSHAEETIVDATAKNRSLLKKKVVGFILIIRRTVMSANSLTGSTVV